MIKIAIIVITPTVLINQYLEDDGNDHLELLGDAMFML
ncbi:MAG: hypothetical protein Rsou_0548 [Candidatus Ruthia sp. Asou_11_S2]|nr:hypothetical protein [Candidatus Ruthia sp. Asou_11_S2]